MVNKDRYFPGLPLVLILPLLLLLQPKISATLDGFLVGQRWRGVADMRLVSSGDSRYQNIALGESAGQYNLYSNGQLATSFPNDADNQVLAAQLLCQHGHPCDILIVGEAAGGLARFVLNYPIRRLTVVEIDRLYLRCELAWLKPQELSAMNDPRLRLIIGDGLSYLNGLRRSATFSGFDIVFLHLPDPATALLNRFYTEDFFHAVRRILAPSGVLALQISLPENYTAGVLGQYSAIIYQTLSAVFPRVALSPALNLCLFASADPDSISQSAAILAQRYRSFNLAPANLAMVFPSLYPSELIASLHWRLAELPVPGLNSNERPVGYYAYSKVLGWYSDKHTAAALALLEGIPYKIIMALSMLAVMFLAICGRQRAKSKQILPLFSRWTLAVAGFAGLSFEIVLLYAFQCLIGQIYHAIGLFTALFMFGLPLGAMVARQGRHWPASGAAAGRFQVKAALALLLLAILIALCPHLLRLLAANKSASLLFIGAAMTSCGFLVGALFPIMLSLHATQAHSARLAGRLYAYDNLGGAMGALFTAAVLIPLWGVSGVCFTIAFLLLNSAILLFFSRRLGK
jgi:spermidine synthase